MATQTVTVGPSSKESRAARHIRSRSLTPVEWWALAGVGYLLFFAYVLIRWVTGPYFTAVEPGPTPQAPWMEVVHIAWQAAAIPAFLIAVYFGVVRPWRRGREISIPALAMIAVLPMMFQDAAPDYTGWFYTLNSHLWNVGSFYAEIPGWSAFSRPGAIIPWTPLFYFIEYPFGIFIPLWLGRRILSSTCERRGWRPSAGMAVVFPAMFVFDYVIEGLCFILLGFYSYPGGKLSLFPDTYAKYPIVNGFWVAVFLTAAVGILYFRNDRGETLAERGLTSIPGGDVKRFWIRTLAVSSVLCYTFLFGYNLPMALVEGLNPGRWPTKLQAESYMTDNLCGPRTNRLCPGPGVPLMKYAWVDAHGHLRGPGPSALGADLHVPPGSASHSTAFIGRVVGNGSR